MNTWIRYHSVTIYSYHCCMYNYFCIQLSINNHIVRLVHKNHILYCKKLKNVSCEYDRVNGWNSTLKAYYTNSLQSWVSTIHTVVLTADVFQLFIKLLPWYVPKCNYNYHLVFTWIYQAAVLTFRVSVAQRKAPCPTRSYWTPLRRGAPVRNTTVHINACNTFWARGSRLKPQSSTITRTLPPRRLEVGVGGRAAPPPVSMVFLFWNQAGQKAQHRPMIP